MFLKGWDIKWAIIQCVISLYIIRYTYTHTHVREIRHEDRLRKDVWEGKGRHCLRPHHRAIFIQVLVSCQSCTQRYHPLCISSLNFLTALIWGHADLTLWVLLCFENRVYKNATSPVCPQVGVSPLVTLMQFFFLFKRVAGRGPEENS